MRQRHFRDLAGVLRVLRNPIPERAAEAVRGRRHVHSSQHGRQAHVGEGTPHPRKHVIFG